MKYLNKPVFTVSYQGETWYQVGNLIPEEGTPKVVARHLVWTSTLKVLNNPNEFWKHLHQIGSIRWNSCVPKGGLHQYPPMEVMKHFPGYLPGRYSCDFSHFEVQGDPPLLCTNGWTFFRYSDATATDTLLWKGTAAEINYEVWWEVIAPKIPAKDLDEIVRNFLRTEMDVPSQYRAQS